jgi:hypothetical protein
MQQEPNMEKWEVRQRLALYSQYMVLSNQTLRIMLVARKVSMPLDRLPRRYLIELAIETHSLVGDSAGIILAVERFKCRQRQKAGPLMVDIPL